MPDRVWTPPLLSWTAISGILHRRRWWLLLCLAGGWIAVASLRYVLPAAYQSQALLLVDQQSVPHSYVEPNVTFNAGQLLQQLGQQVLSHDRLAQVVQQYHLYPQVQARQGLDAAIVKLRQAISIQPVSLASLPVPQKGDWSTIQISFQAASPALAQAVTNDLTTLFIQENLQATQQASAQTTSFLEQQLQQAAAQLQQARAQVQAFERSHLGTLPGQTQTNLAMAMSLQSELSASLGALNRTQQEIASDQALLATAPTPAQQQQQQTLAGLEAQLQTLRARYTAQYPGVVELKQQIVALQRAGVSPAPATGAADGNALTLSQVRSQLHADQLLLPQQQKQVAALRRQVQQYQHRLALAPLPASQLASLQAQEQQAASAYQTLLGKRDASQMASQLEAQQGGAQFRLLDAPALPHHPVSPKPAVLSLLGLAFGLILGVAASAAAELLQDRIRGEAELVTMGLTPILARIPRLRSSGEQVQLRRRVRLEWVAGAVLVLLLVAGNFWMFHG